MNLNNELNMRMQLIGAKLYSMRIALNSRLSTLIPEQEMQWINEAIHEIVKVVADTHANLMMKRNICQQEEQHENK